MRIGALGTRGPSDTDAPNPIMDIDEPLTQKKGDIVADSNPEDNEVDDAALKEKKMVTEITAPSLRIGGAAMAFA